MLTRVLEPSKVATNTCTLELRRILILPTLTSPLSAALSLKAGSKALPRPDSGPTPISHASELEVTKRIWTGINLETGSTMSRQPAMRAWRAYASR